ncbi:MAG: BACON domain-containing protein, partial [Prevotella sp.]|nr:BACON domain-containing protein [Prevotella sp.]
MKLRYLIPSFIALVAMFVSCSENNDPTYLDEVKLSSSYVAIPQEGGQTAIKVTATGDWQLEKVFAVTTKNANNENVTNYYETPAWLKVDKVSGAAGETELTFSAEKTLDGRTCELLLTCGGKTQRINVIQGLSTISDATVAQVMAGPESKTYRVTGTVTSIANTVYGNWYMNDGTSETDLYIYGTLDKNGNAGQNNSIAAWGIEVGDEITVEGPKTLYGSTVELVNVTVVKINKSLIKVDSLTVDGVKTEDPMPVEGGLITANLTCKGNGVSVDIPEDAKSWLSIASIDGSSPAVTFRVAPNDGGDRSTTLTFTTTDGKKQYTSEVV